MKYQWGRKDPFTFATSSLHSGGTYGYGKYPVKIYNSKSELIYQEDIGGDNFDKTPMGGVIYQDIASSIMEAVKNSTTFYYMYNGSVINQAGQSKELWNYYWASYSRGADGAQYKPFWHNIYLDGYIVLRSKSIYDPCPYGYRTSTNGTYTDFKSNTGWAQNSYAGGIVWSNTWFGGIGLRSSCFRDFGRGSWYCTATIQSNTTRYATVIYSDKRITFYGGDCHELMYAHSVRCIEDAAGKKAMLYSRVSISPENEIDCLLFGITRIDDNPLSEISKYIW